MAAVGLQGEHGVAEADAALHGKIRQFTFIFVGNLELFQFLYLVVPVPAPDAAGYLSTISGAPVCSRAFRGASEGGFFFKKKKANKNEQDVSICSGETIYMHLAMM